MPRPVNLNADPRSIEGYFIKGLKAAGLTDEQIKRKFWPEEDFVPVKSKKINELNNCELINEWKYWNQKIESAKNWGASISAAYEFRIECEKELTKRQIKFN